MLWIILFASIFYGAVFGSLFNVLIYRLPRNQSIVKPSSRCPSCRHKIKPYENIPIISYFLLRGKCSNCHTSIPIRYLLVEALTSFYFVLCVYLFYIKHTPNLSVVNVPAMVKTAEALIFGSILIVQSFIDLDWFILLDSFNYGGIAIGLLFSMSHYGFVDLQQSLIGMFCGVIIPLSIYYFYLKVKGIEGLGMGDVKLLAMIGSFGGWYMVLGSLFFGSIIALTISIPTIIKNKNMQYYIPFGPFLSIGAVLWMFCGHYLMHYLKL